MSTTVTSSNPASPSPIDVLLGPDEIRTLGYMARRIAGTNSDWEDLLQSCLLRMVRGYQGFEPGSNLFAWAKTIMQRLHVDAMRARRTRHTLTVAISQHMEVTEPDEGPDQAEPPPRWSPLSFADVLRASEELPDMLRIPFQMFYIDHVPYLEIANALALRPRTVGTRLYRARQRIRALLEPLMDAGVRDASPEVQLARAA